MSNDRDWRQIGGYVGDGLVIVTSAPVVVGELLVGAGLIAERVRPTPVQPLGHGYPASGIRDDIIRKPAEPYLGRPGRRVIVERADPGRGEPDRAGNWLGGPQTQFIGLQPA